MRACIPLLLALSACAAEEESPGGTGGDPAAGGSGGEPAELTVIPVQYVRDGRITEVDPGDDLTIFAAPQGGSWIFVAARVRGLPARPDVRMTARVNDAASDFATTEYTAYPSMSEVAGVWEPDHETFTTLVMAQMCPHEASVDPTGRTMTLTLLVEELNTGARGEVAVEVVPRCEDEDCVSECVVP